MRNSSWAVVTIRLCVNRDDGGSRPGRFAPLYEQTRFRGRLKGSLPPHQTRRQRRINKSAPARSGMGRHRQVVPEPPREAALDRFRSRRRRREWSPEEAVGENVPTSAQCSYILRESVTARSMGAGHFEAWLSVKRHQSKQQRQIDYRDSEQPDRLFTRHLSCRRDAGL
jgi:hypothetical protein